MRVTTPSSDLLAAAQRGLVEATYAETAAERYVDAHLSALRSAAAILAARAQPTKSRTRLRSVWSVLPSIAPECAEWAEFFAASAYLSGEPAQLGSIRGQDIGKLIAAVIVVLGTALATVGAFAPEGSAAAAATWIVDALS